ncbi:MAG: transcriptional repressor [Candidatus Moranbacteria bacterium]|nr:transcriptional repressor [Candidatus Moranbacteria bacterium]
MAQIKTILEKIKADGHRLTKVRKAMVQILVSQGCLLTALDIQQKLKKLQAKADRSTVYRELCFLLEEKIIRKIQLGDDKTYYEISTGHHHHLICNKCNKVQKIVIGEPLKTQEKKINQKEKFKVLSHSLEFYGLCRKCR